MEMGLASIGISWCIITRGEAAGTSGTLHHTLFFFIAEPPNWESWAVQLNAGSGVLKSYQCDEYGTDAEGSPRKADIFADNEDPLRDEADGAVQEAGLGEGVCESCTLQTKILRLNRLKICMSRGRSCHIKLFMTMDEKY